MSNKIDYKFDIDDEVFFIADNKVQSGKVNKVSISIQKAAAYPHGLKPIIKIDYVIDHKKISSNSQNTNSRLEEEKLFESKSKLLDSL